LNDAELAQLQHANAVEALTTEGSHVAGALMRRADGISLIATGLPMMMFNLVLIEDETAHDEAVADAVATLRVRRHPFVVNLRVGTDDRFGPLMAGLGLVQLSEQPWIPGMAMYPISTDDGPSLAGHEIVEVGTGELDDHIRTTAAGLGLPQDVVSSFMTPAALEDPDQTLYTGYTDGEPVSTGVGFRTGRTIGIYNISTVPEARRRGYGEAITRRIATDGARVGCDVAILQSSDMGFPIYKRMGYQTVVEYMGYIEPPKAED